MKLRELGSTRAAIAVALGLAASIGACGGDDTNGPAGTGGSGGSPSMMDAKGGGGSSDAAPDTSQESGPGTGGSTGTGGSAGSDATGTGGAAPESGLGGGGPDGVVTPDGAGGSDASDVSVSSDASDGGITADSSDAPVTPVQDAPEEPAPPNEAAPEAGTSVLYAFNFNAGDPYGWSADNGTVVGIAEGAPDSPGGAIEWTGTLDGEDSVFIQYGMDDGTGATRRDLADVRSIHFETRLHNPGDAAAAGLASIQVIVSGSAAAGSPVSSGDFIDTGSPDEWTAFNAGEWITVNVDVGARVDGGTPDIADLWRIALTLNLAGDSGSIPIVVDIDNVTVTR